MVNKVIVIFVIMSVVLGIAVKADSEMLKTLQAMEKKCKSSFDLKDSDFMGKEVSLNAKCYLNCILEELKVVKNGEVILDTKKVAESSHAALQKLTKLFVDCYDEDKKSGKTDKCEKSYGAYKCMFVSIERMPFVLSVEDFWDILEKFE